MTHTGNAGPLPSLQRFAQVLRLNSWEKTDEDQRITIWSLQQTERTFHIVLPREDRTSDAQEMIFSAADTLAYTLRRTRNETLQDLQEPVEQLLIRLQPPTPAGQAPLSLMESVVTGLRNVIVGTASGLGTRRLVLPTRRPPEAEEFVNRARITSGPGSFIVTMLLPLNAGAESPLPGFEPTGRQVTDLLRQFAETAQRMNTDLISSPTEWQAFINAPDTRTNATVLDGLATIGGPDHLPYQLRLIQSATVPTNSEPLVLEFTGQHQEALAQAARTLRTPNLPSDTRVEGLVVQLKRSAASGPGEVVVEGVYEDSGTTRRVTVNLEERYYADAIQAHGTGRQVSITGAIETRGKRTTMATVTEFKVQPDIWD